MAEGLTFTVGGNGILGDVEPGWSEQEFATPVNPNERAGGTGTVSFAAKDVAAGVLAINKAITSEDAALGQVSGVVRTASKTGQRVAITHDNKLAKYNAVRTMPPMIAASVPDALDLAEQMLGDAGFTGEGIYWSLAGHAVGFTQDGNQAERQEVARQYIDYSAGQLEPFPYTVVTHRGSIDPTSFVRISGKTYAQSLRGETFFFDRPESVEPGAYNQPVNRVRCKTLLNGSDFTFSFEGGVDALTNSPEFFGGQVTTVTIDYSAETLTVAGLYSDFVIDGWDRIPFTSSASLAGLNLDAELAVFIDFGFYDLYSTSGIADDTCQINVKVCNTSDYASFVEVDLNISPDYLDQFYFPWEITGNVRALWTRQDTDRTENPLADWEVARSFAISGTSSPGEPSIGYTGAVWDWLQDACSAYFWEVALDGDVVTARAVGGRTLDTSNFGASPTLAPTTTRTGRSVDVVWQNASVVSTAEVYDARSDDNRIISVGAAQETVTRIQTGAYLTSVVQPTRTTEFIPGEGTYYVIDSTGLPIVANQWEDYGGALSVAIDNAEAGTIEVTLTGPREQIPSTTAPYSLAVSDGQNQYAALSILGSGVVADPQTLNLLTGADPDITPQEVAFTVNNAFINTLEQAYDAGIWAAVDASGPRVTYTIDVPTLNLTGFGDTAGALIQAEDSTYRVIDATVGRTSTSINAVRHATVGAFDDAWAGETVDDHDTYWGTFLCEDQRILPYAGTPEATLPPAPIFPP